MATSQIVASDKAFPQRGIIQLDGDPKMKKVSELSFFLFLLAKVWGKSVISGDVPGSVKKRVDF